MSLYLIGDVQGCDAALQALLEKIGFSPSRDTLYLLGDLVNRGPASDAVLRRLMGYGSSAHCLLGNHDLHLLAVHYGLRASGRRDTLDCLLQAPDRNALVDWLRRQHMALLTPVGATPVLMVHAGVLPQWSVAQTMALARLRVVVNALTRLRFCTPAGQMDFSTSGSADTAPPGYLPWFDAPGRQSANACIAFGHWSTLGWLHRSDVLALDTGCVWGGCLSALRIAEASGGGLQQELLQVQCRQESPLEG